MDFPLDDAKAFENRRLTADEQQEARNTVAMKRKPTLKKEFQKVELIDFNLLMVLGRGAFGKVFLGELNINKQLYAIKSIRKDILIEMDQIESTMMEKDIMFDCDHPYLVSMEYLFQNELRLYFVMPFI